MGLKIKKKFYIIQINLQQIFFNKYLQSQKVNTTKNKHKQFCNGNILYTKT